MKSTLSTGPNIVQKETEIGLSKSCKVTGLNGHRHCQWCWNEFTRPVMLTCLMITISSVQFSSVAQSCPTLCDPMNRSMPGLPVHHQLLEFTQTHVHQVGDAIQPSHPLSSPSPPVPIPPSIRVFSNESTLCMRWPKYWSLSLSISPSNEP